MINKDNYEAKSRMPREIIKSRLESPTHALARNNKIPVRKSDTARNNKIPVRKSDEIKKKKFRKAIDNNNKKTEIPFIIKAK